MGKTLRRIAAIAALGFVAILVSVELVYANITILQTAGKLVNASLYISDYNGSAVKSDKYTAEIIEIQKERDALYNSSDWMIRTYANAPTLFKIVIAFVAFIIIIAVFLFWIYVVINLGLEMRRSINKKASRKRHVRKNVH